MQVSVAPRRWDESRGEGLGGGGELTGQNTHTCTDQRRPPRTREGFSWFSVPGIPEYLSSDYIQMSTLLYIILIFISFDRKRNVGSRRSSASLENILMNDLCAVWSDTHSAGFPADKTDHTW